MDLDQIVKQNIQFYLSIQPKNPPISYTVLATINDAKTGKLLALATGTQANLSAYPDDIEDCHAESLVKRAFKRYLIDNVIQNLREDGNRDQSLDALKAELPKDVILFISQFPCGLLRRYEGDEPVEETTGQTIMRKPGRGTVIDGKTVYVQKENCYSKLRRWAKNGLQGKSLLSLLDVRCKIVKILIGNCEPDDNFEYVTHLRELEQSLIDKTCESIDGSKVKLINFVRQDNEQLIIRPEKRPQPVAVVWWSSIEFNAQADSTGHRSKRMRAANNQGQLELVVDGRKRGITKKQCISGKEQFRLRISSSITRRDLKVIEELLGRSTNPSSECQTSVDG